MKYQPRMDTNEHECGCLKGNAMLVSYTMELDHEKSTPLVHQYLSVFFPRP
jgi:hypothetical protein